MAQKKSTKSDSQLSQRNKQYLTQLMADVASVVEYAELIEEYSKIENEFQLSDNERKIIKKIGKLIRESDVCENVWVTKSSLWGHTRENIRVEYHVLCDAFKRIKKIKLKAKDRKFSIEELLSSSIINREEFEILTNFDFQISREWTVDCLLHFLTPRASSWAYNGFLDQNVFESRINHKRRLGRLNDIVRDLNKTPTSTPSDLAKDILVAIGFESSPSKLFERVLK